MQAQSNNFWQELKARRPFILGLSPMDDITDYPFRAMIKKYGRPDVIFTEFANVEGLCHGAKQILRHFDYDPSQRPLVAQLFGKDPDSFYQVAILLCEMGVDGIDINMGCPAKTVASHGSGAALIKTPVLAKKIVQAVQQAVTDWQAGKSMDDCPDLSSQLKDAVQERMVKFKLERANREKAPLISVKTRIGYTSNEIQEWLPHLLELNLAALTIHGRSLKQRYSGQADWSAIAEAALLCKKISPQTIFLGNGDLNDYEMAADYAKKYQVDGVLIGRASMGNPYVFLSAEERAKALDKRSLLELALEHAQLYESCYRDEEKYSFLPMRKHLACYTKGYQSAKQLRLRLVKSQSAADVRAALTP